MTSLKRIFQRYLVPRFIISLYFLIKYRCLVSMQSRVQLSRQIQFGRGTVVKPYAVISTQGGRITFGRQCAVSSFNHISTGLKDITVGNYVRIAPGVTILGGSRNFHDRNTLIIGQESYHAEVNIGNDVLIGASAVILPGVHIGDGVVIGAGSVVDSDIPPYMIAAGVPVKIVGERK